jgi:hypothetical protein
MKAELLRGNVLVSFYDAPELMGKHPWFAGFRPDDSVGSFALGECPFCGEPSPLAFIGNYDGWKRMGVMVCRRCWRIFDAY